MELGIPERREIVDRHHAAPPVPQWQLVIGAVKQIERCSFYVSRQIERPPTAAHTRETQVCELKIWKIIPLNLCEDGSVELKRSYQFELGGWIIAGQRAGELERVMADTGKRFAERIAIKSNTHSARSVSKIT
jgi:hypothetical protein